MKILNLEEIKNLINLPKIIALQEEGFRLFSAGKVNLPPVGYLKQYNPDGSYHIKYGMIEDDDVWVVKVAGGPSNMPMSGMMVVFSVKTGKPQAILLDDGYLTQLRTAIAGLISAKYLAPKKLEAIGVIGTGEQARLQIELLKEYTSCRKIFVWGRSYKKTSIYREYMQQQGFSVKISNTTTELAQNCNLIITTTSAEKALLNASDIQAGTHITAIGTDSPEKMELDPLIIAKANLIVVDSKSQCIDHGEISHAYKNGLITDKNLIEIGEIIDKPYIGRKNNTQITIADLTGIAIQDIQIAKAILL